MFTIQTLFQVRYRTKTLAVSKTMEGHVAHFRISFLPTGIQKTRCTAAYRYTGKILMPTSLTWSAGELSLVTPNSAQEEPSYIFIVNYTKVDYAQHCAHVGNWIKFSDVASCANTFKGLPFIATQGLDHVKAFHEDYSMLQSILSYNDLVPLPHLIILLILRVVCHIWEIL